MRISDLLRFARERGEPIFSFEFFPPRTDEGVRALFDTVEALRPLGPAYVSVTYGAGGSTRLRTLELVKRLKREREVEAMAHVTCVGASRDELAALLDEIADAGIQNVLALRGDPPRGETTFVPHPEGFAHASELVAFVRSRPERLDRLEELPDPVVRLRREELEREDRLSALCGEPEHVGDPHGDTCANPGALQGLSQSARRNASITLPAMSLTTPRAWQPHTSTVA